MKKNLLEYHKTQQIRDLSITTGEGNGNPLQYACLANSMDGGAW